MNKTLKNITYNDDGSFNVEDSDGVVYMNCWIKSYNTPSNENVIIEEIELKEK